MASATIHVLAASYWHGGTSARYVVDGVRLARIVVKGGGIRCGGERDNVS